MRRTVTINLDKPRELRFNTNATIALEEALGRSVISLMTDAQEVGFREFRAIIWSGLQYMKRNGGTAPTLDEVGDMIDDMIDSGRTMKELSDELGQALGQTQLGNSSAATT